MFIFFFFFSSRRRHTRSLRDWSSDVCSSDLAHDSGQLKFCNTHAGLAEKRTFKHFIAALRRIHWVVHCKAPFAGPEQVLRYLSRYTHRIAISNRRLVAADNTSIAFRWKDYRVNGPGRWKTMRLHPHEFIRRFL